MSGSSCYMGESTMDGIKQARIVGLSPKVSIKVIDTNGVMRDCKEGMSLYDCETVKSIAINHAHDIIKCYTVQVKRGGEWKDAVDIMIAPPVRHWRRDMFYLAGDVDNTLLGHVLRSQS